MKGSECDCWACESYKNREPFCNECDEKCCKKCAEARGAFDMLELLCEGCEEVRCMRCVDEREFPYEGKRFTVYAAELAMLNQQET